MEPLRRRGVLLSTDVPLHNVIKIKPPLVIWEVDIRWVNRELGAAFHSLERGGQV